MSGGGAPEPALTDGSSRLVVGTGVDTVDRPLAGAIAGHTVSLIAAEPVWALHGEAVAAPLDAHAGRWLRITIPDGEAAKTIDVAAACWRSMLDAGVRRDSVVVALGGGSTGDLAGFVAASYMRGLRWVQLPTTVIAQVDAAVGGKTGVNHGGIKNAVGAFHSPELVVAASAFLATLPRRQLASGLVEVVKMAALLDLELLARVEADVEPLLDGDPQAWTPVVAASQRVKAAVVERDPREAGERRVLNFGHTLGHALEGAAGGALTHGEAVGHGIRFALRLAADDGLDAGFVERIERLLGRFELPPLPPVGVEALLAAVARDKKATRDGVVWVLPTAPQAWRATVVDERRLRAALERFMTAGGPA